MAKTVLVIGAGVTRAAAGKVRSLGTCPPLDKDFFQIAEAVAKADFEEIRKLLRSYLGDYSDSVRESLELATSYFYLRALDAETAGTSATAGLSKLLALLARVLAQSTNRLKTGKRSLVYRLIRDELRKVQGPSDLTVITFNYDLIIERALDALGLSWSGAFSFPKCYRLSNIAGTMPVKRGAPFSNTSSSVDGVAVLKLHGSMNWMSKHKSAVIRHTALAKRDRALYVVNDVNIFSSLHWKPKTRTQYLLPIIVPPVAGKRLMMHGELPGLWKKASKALEEADRVVIAGYSCPPLDLEARFLLSESMRKTPTKRVYVVDPSPTTAARFIDICGVNHATIYDSLNAWVHDGRTYATTGVAASLSRRTRK